MRIFFFVFLFQMQLAVLGQESIYIAPGMNDLKRYELFFKGEFHDRLADNEAAFLRLAQHLYKHNKVRYLVFEWGPDFSYLANRYLQTQDDSLLFKNTLEFRRAFWDTLVELNRDKPNVDKIKIGGFDFNRSVYTGKAFSFMMRGKSPYSDPAIQTAIEDVIKWKDIKWSWEVQGEFVKQVKKLRSLCKKQEPALMAYFDEDWPFFYAIINHDVDSKSMVTRDKKGIKYVKEFLQAKGAGAVLFKFGISHTFLDGKGIGKMLNDDPQYRGKVCSLYPYYQLPLKEKTQIQLRKDSYLPSELFPELESSSDYRLVNMEKLGFYPKKFTIAQWVYVIPKVNP